MKKVLSALIVAVMLIGMLPAVAISAVAEPEGNLTYTISGKGAIEDSLPLSFNACEEVTCGKFCAFLADIFDYKGVELDGQLPFTDVPADYKYAKGIEWAYKHGIVAGDHMDRFNPENRVTRVEAAILIYRIANSMGMELREEKDYTQICVDLHQGMYYTAYVNGCLNNNLMTVDKIDGELYFRPDETAIIFDFANIYDAFPDEHVKKETYDQLFSKSKDHIYTDECDSYCNACNEPRNAPHIFDYDCDRECNECHAQRPPVQGHRYDNACDTECNDCKAIRSIIHTYDDVCDTECNICKTTRSVTHTYDDTCDTECNNCGLKRTITHKYYAAFLADEVYHWLECAICQNKKEIGVHTYSNACDTDCNVCKATRTITHDFGGYVYNEDATSKKDGTKTRICSVCQKTETVTATGTKLENPFKDVKLDQYYAEPVLWAVEKEITKGVSETSFAPDNKCTRGQIVTFLWRAAGSPEPQSGRNPFVDVPSDQYYYKAVLWAVEKGITTGMDATNFSPDASCTRGQIVTFLWRAKGNPAASSSNPFYDVSGSAYYYSPVLWAVKNSITTGMSATSFAPDAPCTRAQIVTFLYRAYK